jgi:hypothetical protein
MIALVAIFLFVMAQPFNVLAEDKMYKCDDGTFTNRADLHCPPYELHGQIIVITEASLAASRDKMIQGKVTVPARPPARSKDTTGDRK